jgi:hypothetical protein
VKTARSRWPVATSAAASAKRTATLAPSLWTKWCPIVATLPKVPCGREPVKEDCQKACERKLSGCEHLCRAKCAEECTVNCREVDSMQMSSCGHEVKRICFEARQGLALIRIIKFSVFNCCRCLSGIAADVLRCNAACDADLVCGHKCKGTCKSCHQGRFHVPCKDKSPRELVCGHRYSEKDLNFKTIDGLINSCFELSFSSRYECSLLHPPPCNADISLTCEHGEIKVKCEIKVLHNCKVS